MAKENLGRHLAAITDYDTAIRLRPDYAFAYYNRGLAQYSLNRTRAAKKDFQTALKLAGRGGDRSLKALVEETMRDLR